jgi:CheY-like chemotaxis protein
MGGKINEIKSSIGKGTYISFTINQKSLPETRSLDFSNFNYNVLIVDDDQRSGALLSDLLGKLKISSFRLDPSLHLADELRRSQYTHVLITLNSKYQITNEDFQDVNFVLLVDKKESVPPRLLKYSSLRKPFDSMEIYKFFNVSKEANNELLDYFGSTALLVDDDPINLMVLEAYLRQHNIACKMVGTGKEVLSNLQSNRYDIIFLDQIMAEMTGAETAGFIRRTKGDYFSKVPLIAVTSETSTTMLDVYYQSGINEVLSKPIDYGALDIILGKYLKVKKDDLA